MSWFERLREELERETHFTLIPPNSAGRDLDAQGVAAWSTILREVGCRGGLAHDHEHMVLNSKEKTVRLPGATVLAAGADGVAMASETAVRVNALVQAFRGGRRVTVWLLPSRGAGGGAAYSAENRVVVIGRAGAERAVIQETLRMCPVARGSSNMLVNFWADACMCVFEHRPFDGGDDALGRLTWPGNHLSRNVKRLVSKMKT